VQSTQYSDKVIEKTHKYQEDVEIVIVSLCKSGVIIRHLPLVYFVEISSRVPVIIPEGLKELSEGVLNA